MRGAERQAPPRGLARRVRLDLAWLLALSIALGLSTPCAAGEVAIPEAERADAASVDEIYGQGVDDSLASVGPMLYLQDVLLAVLTAVAEWLGAHQDLLDWLRADFVVLALRILVFVLGLGVAFLLLRALVRRWRPSEAGDDETFVEAPAASRSAVDWAAELRRRLAAGEVPGSLEALWWWLAHALDAADADPAWTSRELLVHAGRLDLRRDVGRLDRLIYADLDVAVDDVDGLWHHLRRRLEGGASR